MLTEIASLNLSMDEGSNPSPIPNRLNIEYLCEVNVIE